jgi:hypothetical protein
MFKMGFINLIFNVTLYMNFEGIDRISIIIMVLQGAETKKEWEIKSSSEMKQKNLAYRVYTSITSAYAF